MTTRRTVGECGGARPAPSRARLAGVLAALALVWIGCGIEEFPTSLGEGALPGDPLRPLPTEASCDVSVNCNCEGGGGGDTTEPPPACDAVAFGVDDLAGFAWRFESLVLTAPIPPGVIADGLNTFFADEIAAGNVTVLLAVDEDDRATCAVDGRLGSGDAAGGGHRFTGEATPIALTLTASGFRTADPSALDFPTEQLTPPILPLRRVELSGTFPEGAAAIEDGTLVAAVTVEDAKGIKMLGASFDVLLTGLAAPDLDLDGDGTEDAWRFVGTFTATKTTLE